MIVKVGLDGGRLRCPFVNKLSGFVPKLMQGLVRNQLSLKCSALCLTRRERVPPDLRDGIEEKQVYETRYAFVGIAEPHLTTMNVVVIAHRDHIPRVIFDELHGALDVPSRHTNIQVVIPWDEATVTNGAKERSGLQPIRKAMSLAKDIELEEKLRRGKLIEAHIPGRR